MLVKQRDYPFTLWELEALQNRVPYHLEKREKILYDLIKEKAGYNGEQQLDFPLSFLDKQSYFILHHLRLRDENGYFQIDSLILTTRFNLILEVKNWYGTVIFSQNDQVTRRGDDHVEEGFPNPVPQAQLQQHRLKNYLKKYNIHMPITFYIVISFPQTIVASESPNQSIPPSVIRNEQLFFKINQLDQMFTTEKATRSQVFHTAKLLVKAHTPYRQNIIKKYNLTAEQLIKGVICPKCQRAPMIRNHGAWHCRSCGHSSTNSHLSALRDYQLLIGNKITNKHMRDFLKIKSPYVAKRLLQKLDLKTEGTNRWTVYFLDFFNIRSRNRCQ